MGRLQQPRIRVVVHIDKAWGNNLAGGINDNIRFSLLQITNRSNLFASNPNISPKAP